MLSMLLNRKIIEGIEKINAKMFKNVIKVV
jgi:hypothetical protein